MQIISNEVVSRPVYGNIVIRTKVGDLKYSYVIGTEYDDNHQLESPLTNIHLLTPKELDEIHDLIIAEMYKKI